MALTLTLTLARRFCRQFHKIVFFVELITRFGPIDSESDRGVVGSHLAFAHRIEEILEFHGKSSGSLKDLIDLKLDLEDASKREEILLPYFSSKKEAKS